MTRGVPRTCPRPEAVPFGTTPGCTRFQRAFTLIELLVTIAIIGILLSLVVPMVGKTLKASRSFKCQQTLRSVAYDFTIFADDMLHGNRGVDSSGQSMSSGPFLLENFVESQFSIDEFWAWPGEIRRDLPDAAGNDPMRCPEVRGAISLRANAPCYNGAIGPYQNLSYGFNIRLRVAEQVTPFPAELPVALTSRITDVTNVPLVWDVDGAAAAGQGQFPLFSGPSLDSPAIFSGDRYWFPALRHNGVANVAFTDGHVASTSRPLQEEWNWAYSPRR